MESLLPFLIVAATLEPKTSAGELVVVFGTSNDLLSWLLPSKLLVGPAENTKVHTVVSWCCVVVVVVVLVVMVMVVGWGVWW